MLRAVPDFTGRGSACRRSTRRFARPPSTMCWSRAAAGRSARRALRAVAALLLAACIGGAAMAWHYHAEAAQRMIAEWAPLFARNHRSRRKKPALAAPPVLAAAEVDAANAAPAPQPAPAARRPQRKPLRRRLRAGPCRAASPDEPQSLETMARDLANAGQEIEQLKASVEQLKASQQQLVAMVSEKAAAQNLRAQKTGATGTAAATGRRARACAQAGAALPPRPSGRCAPIMPSSRRAAAAGCRRLTCRDRSSRSATAAETLNDPELGSVPRPPMPLR